MGGCCSIWSRPCTSVCGKGRAWCASDWAGAWAALTSGLAQVGTDYQTYLASLGTLLLSFGATLAQTALSWGQALIDWIAPYVPLALAQLQAWASQIAGWIVAQAPAWAAQLAGWGQAFIGWIAPYVGQALAALGAFGGQILGWIGAQAGALGAQIATWGQAFIAWIPGATVQFLAAWPGMLASFLDWIAGAVGPLLAQLGLWALAFVQWIAPQIPNILAGLAGIAAALITFVVETAAVLASRVVIWAASLLGWIATNVLPALPGLLASILGTITGWITSAATALAHSALAIGKSLVDGIRAGIEGAWGKLTSWISAQVAKIPEPIRAALGIHSPSAVIAALVGVPIAQGIGAGFAQALPKVTTNLVNGVAGLMDKIATAVERGSVALKAVSAYQGTGGSGLAGFLAAIKELAIQFNDAAVSLGGRILGTATRFADTIGKVTAPIDTALKGLAGLIDFVAPARTNITAFTASLAALLTALNFLNYLDRYVLPPASRPCNLGSMYLVWGLLLSLSRTAIDNLRREESRRLHALL